MRGVSSSHNSLIVYEIPAIFSWWQRSASGRSRLFRTPAFVLALAPATGRRPKTLNDSRPRRWPSIPARRSSAPSPPPPTATYGCASDEHGRFDISAGTNQLNISDKVRLIAGRCDRPSTLAKRGRRLAACISYIFLTTYPDSVDLALGLYAFRVRSCLSV